MNQTGLKPIDVLDVGEQGGAFAQFATALDDVWVEEDEYTENNVQ